jgi:hypothetical protein
MSKVTNFNQLDKLDKMPLMFLKNKEDVERLPAYMFRERCLEFLPLFL